VKPFVGGTCDPCNPWEDGSIGQEIETLC